MTDTQWAFSELAYEYLTLLVVGLLIFWLASRAEVRATVARVTATLQPGHLEVSCEEDGESDLTLRFLIVTIALAVVFLGVIALVLVLVMTHIPSLVAVGFAGIVTAVAWHAVRRLWRRFGRPTHGRGSWVLVHALWLTSALACGFAWLLFPTWPVYDGTFFLLVIAAARTGGSISMRTAIVAVGLLIAYDVWGVWMSGVTVQLATALGAHPLPILFLVPLQPWAMAITPASGLGIGDFVISSMIVGAFRRHALARWAAGGWALGLLATLLLPFTWSPALLTLLPSIMLVGGVGYLVRRVRAGWAPLALADRRG